MLISCVDIKRGVLVSKFSLLKKTVFFKRLRKKRFYKTYLKKTFCKRILKTKGFLLKKIKKKKKRKLIFDNMFVR